MIAIFNVNLRIEQSFWSHTVVGSNGTYIVSKVKVTNGGNVPLKDVKIYVDLDDTSILFDAELCNSGGTVIDSGEVLLSFGDLAPGASSSQKSYWWTVRERIDGATGTETSDVYLNLLPEFVVSMRSVEGFRSTSKLDKS
ncbi:MAG: hypothetical protein QNJ33_04120 [Crocosphaera sp.]|nr:hypothetical protein [Crocosphaera sp.]